MGWLIAYGAIALLHLITFLVVYIGGPFADTQMDKDSVHVQIGKIVIALGMSIFWIVLAIVNSLLRMKENGDWD